MPPNRRDLENGGIQARTELRNGQRHLLGARKRTTTNARAPLRASMPAGHPRLAEVMSRRPQMGIYRRFGYLNAQNLLYMQAELVSLENRLKELQKQDARETGEASRRAGNWKVLSKATNTTTASPDIGVGSAPQSVSCCGHKRCEEWCCGESNPHEHCDQWNLAMKIREKLRRYNEALIQQRTLASAGEPDSYDLEWIQRFLDSKKFGMEGALLGEDHLLWGSEEHEDDLIALVSTPKRDAFNEWIFKKLTKRMLDPDSWWHSVLNQSLEAKTLLRGITAASGAVVATVPIVSIVALYLTRDTNIRLVLLAVFNPLAAFVLYIFTDAQPKQVFAISAAYNAVNIVFIGADATAGR